MATAAKVSELLDFLPNSSDKLSSLAELKTLLSSIRSSSLQDVFPNVSLAVIFDLLDTADGEQIALCCSILETLFETIEPAVLISEYETELLQGLGHPAIPVKQLSLKQVLRASISSSHQMAPQADILIQLITLLGDDNLDVASRATDILVKLGENTEQLYAMFQDGTVNCMNVTSQKSDTIRFRVYEMVVKISCLSPEALEISERSGMLQQLVNEVYKDEILVQLNCLELLKDLALYEHGFSFLNNHGVVSKLEGILATVEEDPLAAFLLPGLVKFFGNIAHIYPRELNGRFQGFISTVFNLLSHTDMSLRCIAIETLAFIGSTSDGKMALERQGSSMDNACHRIGSTVRDSATEIRVRSLQSMATLLHIHVAEQTAELLLLTENWFRNLCTSPMEVLMEVGKQPFTELRCTVFSIYKSLALTPWGQHTLNNHPGFNEYLLDRSTEKTKEGKEGKYDIVSTLVESPTACEIYGRPYFVRLKEYHNDGAFFVRAEAAVAFEGES